MARRSRRARPQRGLPPAPADRRPRFEALSVLLDVAPGRPPAAAANRLRRTLGVKGWRVELVTEDGTEIELVPPRRVAVARAWDYTYALRAEPEVVHAEPLFQYDVPEMADVRAGRASGVGGRHDPATDTDYEWSLETARVLDAWRLFGTRPPGADVRVGHPDTGYTPHPELAEPARILVGAGYDFEDDYPDPLDDLVSGRLDNPGHGTGTGSVILSGAGAMAGAVPFVSGAAPGALLIPIRTTESVVLWSMRRLRQAVDHAAAQGAQVISMSLGGPLPSLSLRRAIDRASDGGTIVLAAAGNHVGAVVFPAAFDEVIAVAASNINDKPWPGSSAGDAVDITAPGESVWRAEVRRDGAGTWQFDVERGNGTSFAVATVAGVAALWISYHGWTTLVQRYGSAAAIPRVFKHLLQQTCRTPRGWDTVNYGPGIVDARALLDRALPVSAPARKLRDPRRSRVSIDTTGIEMLVHLLPDVPRTRIEDVVAGLLRVPDRDLPAALRDFGEELVFQLVMQPALLETIRARARGGRARGSIGQAVGRQLKASTASRRLRSRVRRA